MCASSVQRYFFTIHEQDQEEDLDGTYLPDVAAALSYASCVESPNHCCLLFAGIKWQNERLTNR
jgi:hypothetical protein